MGGKALPYDAEIEYLEINTGCGFIDIDTGYIPTGLDNDIYITITHLSFPSGTTRHCYFHNGNVDKGRRHRLNRSPSNNTQLLAYNGSSASITTNAYGIINVTSNTLYTIEFHNSTQTVVCNETSYNAKNSEADEDSGYSVHIFGLFGDNPPVNPYCKFHSFKWYKAGKLELDIIPVRIGDKGYLYDKVKNRLLPNIEAGEFILGPDK